jgi:hypothetical protein
MKLTQYWAWYRQRVMRTWHDRPMPSAHMIRNQDAKYLVYCDPQRLLRPSWCDTILNVRLVTHLPHEMHVTNHPDRSIHNPSVQEIWCAQHVGVRDRDWIYMGRNTWRFRLADSATQFQLTWS